MSFCQPFSAKSVAALLAFLSGQGLFLKHKRYGFSFYFSVNII